MEKTLQHRFRRLEGQLASLQKDLEAGKDCTEVIPQFLAVRGAFSAAFSIYLKGAIKECATKDEEKLNALITLLTK